MPWIQVHEDLLYSVKLRRLAKLLGCGRAEAIGILVFLWLFAVFAADLNGEIKCVEPKDFYKPELQNPKYTADEVVSALIQTGFLEYGDEQDSYIIHDWADWQYVWIAEKRKRSENAEYMRKYRENRAIEA
ncbi:hypothetical protein [Acetonema longum]|uniref:Uncharacterized protein n=1 Tax=Acetonema longum DSM 6540 TaxID=1009370 RepID=F7NN05_9FIRM|nr:hypothetical protein [Acetonema longum]EGO62583.1 hypothetical protein ALO_17441 [Acetonema longum DSM 6540]